MKYEAHDYQKYATAFIEEHPVSAILLDMGLGKSVITLTAISDLLFDSFEIHRVLVIAPLRVARDTWPAELEKWEHLHSLIYSVAVGTEVQRKAALLQKADIFIINRENVEWLVEKSGLPFDYDMVVVDELSSFICAMRSANKARHICISMLFSETRSKCRPSCSVFMALILTRQMDLILKTVTMSERRVNG